MGWREDLGRTGDDVELYRGDPMGTYPGGQPQGPGLRGTSGGVWDSSLYGSRPRPELLSGDSPVPSSYAELPGTSYGPEESSYGYGPADDYDYHSAVTSDAARVAEARVEEARMLARRSRSRWIGLGAVASVLIGGGIYVANKFGQDIKAMLPHTVTEVTDPTAALTSVKIDLRTPLVEGIGNATSAIDNHVEVCPPLIGCHTVPLSGHHASARIKNAELDVEAEPGAIVLKPEKDANGQTFVVAVIQDPSHQIRTKIANEVVQTDGNSDFFPALAEAFHHSNGQSAMVDSTRTVAEEEFQKSCAKALDPVIAPATVARVRQSVNDIMPVLKSVSQDLAAQVGQIVARPMGVQFGDGEASYAINSPSTIKPGTSEVDFKQGPLDAKGFESVVATPDCAISPAAQADIMKESDKASGGYFIVSKDQAAQYGTNSNTPATPSPEAPASGTPLPSAPAPSSPATAAPETAASTGGA